MLEELQCGLFSNNSRNVSIDRLSLVELGVRKISVFSSWEKAAKKIEIVKFEIAIVDESLHDISGSQCVIHLKRYSSRTMPIIMVTNDKRRDSVLNSISAGCGGYVLRPYSLETLKRHLLAASRSATPDEIEQEMLSDAKRLVSNGQFDDAIEELEELVDDTNPAVDYYEKGMSFLSEEKYGKAIIAFNKAVAMNEMYAEAYKAMAEAYKGKGNMEKYQEYLNMAADIYATQDRLDEAKKVFIEILQNDPDALNPFNRLGVKLRKDGDYKGAVRAYHQANEITPNDPNLFYNMARAYVFAEDCENALKYTEKCLELDPDMEHATELREQIMKKCSIPLKQGVQKDMSGRVLIDTD